MSTMPAWNEAQIVRFNFRNALFSRRGLTPNEAEALADKLAFRDYERDDRRVCVECSSWQRKGTCFKRLPTSQTQLVRCHGFSFSTP